MHVPFLQHHMGEGKAPSQRFWRAGREHAQGEDLCISLNLTSAECLLVVGGDGVCVWARVLYNWRPVMIQSMGFQTKQTLTLLLKGVSVRL